MAVTDMDLQMRSKQLHRANLMFASLLAAAGVLLMITIAMLPLGLFVFIVGLTWLGLAILLGRSHRNRRETQRSPGEAHEG